MKTVIKICLLVFVGLFILSGCGMSKESEVSVKSVSSKPQPIVAAKGQEVATVTDIAKSSVQGKPEVSRVVITLDKKVSYSTSRQGNQLIINIFSARMKSSLKELEFTDPVIKAIVAKQVGNSVKGVVDLTTSDIAYTPSTSTNPFQIFLDVWPISPKLMSKQQTGKMPSPVIPSPAQKIDIDTSKKPAQKQVSLKAQETPGKTEQSQMKMGERPSSQDVPAQLTWFSEKLSQVLQEREKIKQELVEIEKNIAVKDSMIQVLERKLKEANVRIVELEEELIKEKSKTSLVEQRELTMRDELQQLLTQIETASGGQVTTVLSPAGEDEIKSRSQRIISRISSLQQKTEDLNKTQGQVSSLRSQIDSLIAERDELRTQNETYATQIETLNAKSGKLAAVQEELRTKDLELARLRRAIGNAAKLVMEPSQQPVTTMAVTPQSMPQTTTMSPSVPSVPSEPSETRQSVETPDEPEDSGLVLADLIQQQQVMAQSVNPEDYVLGPEDVIQVKVLNEENLDKTVTVSSDGFITYPLLGDLRVDGLTTAQLDAQISSLLSRDFLVDPEVIVEVVKQRSKKVYIMGAVKQPGYHELPGDQRLLGTLLNAGGPTSFNTEVRVLRLPKQDIMGEESVDTLAPIIIDLNKLFVEGDQSQNVFLQDGDVLMIAPKTASSALAGGEKLGPQQFYVVGSVIKPGIYNYKDDDTVLDAVLRAGGFSEFASRNSTKLVRDTDGKTKTFRVKMKDVMEKGDMDKNIPIMPGDMIIVPESFF